MDGTHLELAIAPPPRFSLLEIARAVAGVAAEAIAGWRRYRRARSVREALAGLDDRMLRDLGFHRDEIGSVAAEYSGATERTRLQVLRSTTGL